MSQQLFHVLGKIHAFFNARTWLTKPIGAILEKWTPAETKEDLPWEDEADLAILEQTPLRAKKILYWMLGVLTVLLVWAAFTKIDEVTRGEGRVIPSKQVQVIQSLDGGIVSEILVHEGQTVKD